ncbi:Anthranilate synthase beta subunit 2, chloroplastic, partial [Ananas comosus]
VKSGVLSNRRSSFTAPIQAVTAERAFVSNGYKKDSKPIIVIDNYDSFTYNLCQYMGDLGASFEVYRNDEITVEEIKRKQPRGILISPGPGTPQDSGISLQTVLELGPSIPLFGVCMGLQCIGEAFGGKIVRSPSGVVHGKSSLVYYDEKLVDTLFSGVPNPFQAGRYHSLVIEKDSFPSDAPRGSAVSSGKHHSAGRKNNGSKLHQAYRRSRRLQLHSRRLKSNLIQSRTTTRQIIDDKFKIPLSY